MPIKLPKLDGFNKRKRRWTADTHLPFDEEFANVSVVHRWSQVVARCSENTAISAADITLSYQQVDQRAERIASVIQGVAGASDFVALLFENGCNPLIALIATLKTGRMFTPLNAALPRKSLVSTLTESLASIIVTDDAHHELARQISQAHHRVINIDDLPVVAEVCVPGLPVDGESLLGLVFTSGSTGKPKGVMLPHKYFMFWAWRSAFCYQYTFSDRIALLYEWSYVDGIGTALETLLNGSILCISDIARNDPGMIPEWVKKQKITMLPLTIPLMRYLAKEESISDASMGPHLEFISTTSMNLSWNDLTAFITRFDCKDVKIEYAYGLSEASIVTDWVPSSVDHASREGQVFAGTQSFGCELSVVDEKGKTLPEDEEGEIVVSGEYLALGYWRSPVETENRFSVGKDGWRTFLTGDIGILHGNGLLEILGRKDSQVKIRGYRVDLSSIELAIQELSIVKEVAVLAVSTSAGDNEIAAYLATDEKKPRISEIRETLRTWLADHEIPNYFVFMDSLPMNANGNKIDRLALSMIEPTRPHLEVPFITPRTIMEQQLSRIWCSVLELERVGIRDSFLLLGGSSLQAAQVHSRVRDSIVEIPAVKFFSVVTIETQAKLMESYLNANYVSSEREEIEI